MPYLQTDGNLAIRNRHQHVCHVGIASRSDETSTELVPCGSVKTGGNCAILALRLTSVRAPTNDQIRVKLLGDRHDNLLERIHVVAIAHALLRPRDINVPAQSASAHISEQTNYLPTPGPAPQ
jgi:hypothetical protein